MDAAKAAEYASRAGWTTLAERHGFAVVAPQQTAANNPNRCFNWFNRADVVRGQGEVASIAAMVDWMIKIEACDPTRVYVSGWRDDDRHARSLSGAL